MSLMDDLKNAYQPKGTRCTVSVMLDQLEPRESKAVVEAIDDDKVSLTALSRILLLHGHTISARTLRRHRNRNQGDGCACP